MVARWLSRVPGLPPTILPTLMERECPASMARLYPPVDLFGSAQPCTHPGATDWLTLDHMSTSGAREKSSPCGGACEWGEGRPPKGKGEGGGKGVSTGPCHTAHGAPSAASTGGNAGIAAAYSARRLGIPATIVLPEGAPLQVVRRLQGEGAEVQLVGKVRTPARGSRPEWALPPSLPPHKIVSFPFRPTMPGAQS